MSYKDLKIEPSYETNGKKTQLLDEFYIPFLSQSAHYFRIAGFFSSSSLAIASKGIEGLVKNNGSMRLLISPKISEQDYNIIKKTETLENEKLQLINNLDVSDFTNVDNLALLAWMLANKKLEIKIVIVKNNDTSLFHQKIGIGFDMDGNMLSFSGSINESAQAWLSNIEEFKTFKSWEEGQNIYLLGDLEKFNAYWNDEKQDIAKVYDLPSSLKKKIISVAPRDVTDLSIMKKYRNSKKENVDQISLFAHQKKAVLAWQDNSNKILMEMATGTGKTRAAIGCFLTQKNTIKNYLVIVATPQNPLSNQWKKEVEIELKISFDCSQIIDSTISKWDEKLETILLNLNAKLINNAILYCVHKTVSSKKFISIIKSNKFDTKILFICDEVHGIGSEKQKEALLEEYDYRIGLSATPERMYDDSGSSLIREYFGNKSFEFTIADALNTINELTGKPFLNPYYYYPVFVKLTNEERQKYIKYTKRILYLRSLEDVDQKKIELQRMLRSNILKNAQNKISCVDSLIKRLNNHDRIKDTIIFAPDNCVETVLKLLGASGISRCKITEHESTSKKMGTNGLSERDELINQFRKGNIQVLVGLKCLDEGIDIKNARIAILMASSTNPREYVQRIGRVVRPAKDKAPSEIYDFIVEPSYDNKTDENILLKEAKRALAIAKNAINYDKIRSVFNEKGVDIDNYD